MENVLTWLQGKKTYITAIVVAVLAGLQAAGIEIPSWVDTLTAALGLGTLRAAVGKIELK